MARLAVFILFFAFVFVSSAYAQTDAQIAARLTPLVHICEKAPENGGTLQQALCYKDEAARQDAELNKIWDRVMRRASPARRKSMRSSERQWIKYRNEDCHGEASGYINSTASYMFNLCMANKAIRRTIWLEHVP